jgi:hypothetical protein
MKFTVEPNDKLVLDKYQMYPVKNGIYRPCGNNKFSLVFEIDVKIWISLPLLGDEPSQNNVDKYIDFMTKHNKF